MRKWLILAVVVIVLDQITKVAITSAFSYGETLYITSFFNLVLAHNTGAAFSFLAGAGGWQRWFFTAVAVLASVVIVHLLRKHADEKWFCLALALILGGAIGNVIDRVRFGYVVDFVQLHAAGIYWPAFNVADSAITVGAVLIVILSFRPQPATSVQR
jgi:signal peptidase II